MVLHRPVECTRLIGSYSPWCDGHHFALLRLSLAVPGKMACYNLVRELRAKDLAILLPHHFEVVRLLLLTVSFSLRAFLLL